MSPQNVISTEVDTSPHVVAWTPDETCASLIRAHLKRREYRKAITELESARCRTIFLGDCLGNILYDAIQNHPDGTTEPLAGGDYEEVLAKIIGRCQKESSDKHNFLNSLSTDFKEEPLERAYDLAELQYYGPAGAASVGMELFEMLLRISNNSDSEYRFNVSSFKSLENPFLGNSIIYRAIGSYDPKKERKSILEALLDHYLEHIDYDILRKTRSSDLSDDTIFHKLVMNYDALITSGFFPIRRIMEAAFTAWQKEPRESVDPATKNLHDGFTPLVYAIAYNKSFMIGELYQLNTAMRRGPGGASNFYDLSNLITSNEKSERRDRSLEECGLTSDNIREKFFFTGVSETARRTLINSLRRAYYILPQATEYYYGEASDTLSGPTDEEIMAHGNLQAIIKIDLYRQRLACRKYQDGLYGGSRSLRNLLKYTLGRVLKIPAYLQSLTPLHFAVLAGLSNAIIPLLNDPSINTDSVVNARWGPVQETALQIAYRLRVDYPEIITILLQSGKLHVCARNALGEGHNLNCGDGMVGADPRTFAEREGRMVLECPSPEGCAILEEIPTMELHVNSEEKVEDGEGKDQKIITGAEAVEKLLAMVQRLKVEGHLVGRIADGVEK